MPFQPFQAEAYETALHAWVTAALPDHEVVFSRQSMARPEGDYITIHVPTMVPTETHFPESNIQCPSGIGVIQGWYDGMGLITALRGLPMKALRKLTRSIGNGPMMEDIKATGLRITRVHPIVDVSEIVSEHWERRAQLEINFGWCETEYFTNWDTIDDVAFEGTYT